MPVCNRLSVLALLLASASVCAGRPDPVEAATGLAPKQLVDGLVAVTRSEPVTLTRPLESTVIDMFGPAALTLRPVQCRLAFENAHGRLHDCPRRSAHVSSQVGAISHAVRARTALWQSVDGARAAAFVFYELSPTDGDKALLKALSRKRFAVVPLSAEAWNSHVVSGLADVSLADQLDSAAAAALAASSRTDEYKPLHAVAAPPPGQAVVWGDLRAEGEVTIQKLDGKTTWHVPFNGFAQALTVPAGAHMMRLVMLGRSGPREYEQDLAVELTAGHTYVVSQGADDRPRLEDLGPAVQCERRKLKMLMAAGPGNAWLACSRTDAPKAAGL